MHDFESKTIQIESKWQLNTETLMLSVPEMMDQRLNNKVVSLLNRSI